MVRKYIYLLAALGLIILSACSQGEARVNAAALTFNAAVNLRSDGETQIALEIANSGNAPFEGSKDFNGMMQLIQDGDLRACANTVQIGSIQAGEQTFPMDWKGKLDAGSYTLLWGASGYGFSQVDFTIEDLNGKLAITHQQSNRRGGEPQLCSAQLSSERDGDITITEVKVSAQGSSPEITVSGTASLPEETCLNVQMYLGEAVSWWPAEVCTQVINGRWERKVSLGQNGAPESLPNGTDYVFRAWQQDHPEAISEPFWFNISPPPGAGN